MRLSGDSPHCRAASDTPDDDLGDEPAFGFWFRRALGLSDTAVADENGVGPEDRWRRRLESWLQP